MNEINDARARKNVAVLVAAQAILGAQMPLLFTVGGLAGQILSPFACLATLPISLIVFGSMATAPWLSPLMQRRGRRFGFVLGALSAMLGAAVAAAGLYTGSFVIFLIGSLLTGIYMSAQGFYRFAAADTASDAFRPKAISYVMAGGLFAALIARQINVYAIEALAIPYLGSYLMVVVLNLIGLPLLFLLDLPDPKTQNSSAQNLPPARSRREILRDPTIVVAIIVGLVSYSLMNLVMTSTPLAVVGCGFGNDDASTVVMAHVLAMFAPSFFTGHLIARFGTLRIMGTGLVILAGAGVVALMGVALSNFYIALILLGLGWNFGFIGATTLLTSAHRPNERGVVQGLNDMIVFGSVTVASLASGGLMNCSGGSPVEGWTAVNLAMVPFLALAGLALVYMAWRRAAN